MSQEDMLKGFVASILKPIITEAVKEATAQQNNTPEKRYYTPEQAQEHLHISRATFYRNVKKGRIEILKFGNKSLIDADKLDEAIERKEVYRYKH
jgi:excisionase family DNA binding protein